MARLYLLILCWVASSGIYAEIDDVMRHKIETRLQTSFPELKIDAIEVAPMSEFYQVIAGTEVYYLSKDGRYIFFGEVLDLNLNEEKWNISEQRRQALRREYIGKIPSQDLITYQAEKRKTFIYIFTDVDCVYCRRIHQHIPELLAAGIEVRYFAFPRQGLNSENYKKMRSIWCSDNAEETLTSAKNGGKVEERHCDNSVAEQYKLGLELGIRGTPTILFANGAIAFGYMPAKQLINAAIEHAQF